MATQRPHHTADSPSQPHRQDADRLLHAPYNFVPLSRWVHIPPWSRAVSHDLPFQDGYSGTLHLTLTNHTPLLVGGTQVKASRERHGEVCPFRLPNGGYAIPGSSLKGMLRAVVEIAGFGRMRMVDDRRMSVRDLTPAGREFYGKRLTNTVKDKTFEPNSRAGWLAYDTVRKQWTLTPCEFARVEHRDLAAFSKKDWWKRVPGEASLRGENRASCMVEEKYTQWGMDKLGIRFKPSPENVHPHSDGKRLVYVKALDLGSGGKKGRLVFTGQPAANDGTKGKKHLEFIFYDESSAIDVSERVIQDFLRIHEASAVWAFWKKQNARVPVFYLTDEKGQIQSLGLALMYRLAYPYSMHDMICHSSPDHLAPPGLDKGYDLADLLFGAINDSKDANAQVDAMRARVSCGLLVAQGRSEVKAQPLTILNGPKPSYFPNYVTQPKARPPGWRLGEPQSGKPSEYASYIASAGNGAPTLRGFKRYPVRPIEQTGVQRLTGEQESNCAVQVQLHTIEPGARFTGRILFHNLKTEELGALLWAITWGGQPGLRHALGMGKPFGFGQASIAIDYEKIEIIPNDPQHAPHSLSAEELRKFIDAFKNHMDAAASASNTGLRSWQDSPQVANLLAMADPEAARQAQRQQRDFLTHPILGVGGNNNPFQQAKKDGKVLPDYAVFTGRMQYVAPFAGTSCPRPQAGVVKPPAAPAAAPAPVFQESVNTWTNCTVTYDPGKRSVEASGAQRGVRASAASLDDLPMDDALKAKLRKDKKLSGLTVEVLQKGASMAQIRSIRKL